MLELLHIENIAIIEKADIHFQEGFSVLTGETGAGKSILIGAIQAILGQRTRRDLIRTGAKKGFVSAVFTHLSPALLQRLEELDLSPENDTLIVQREMQADGKNSCRVNMRPVTTSLLRELSVYLIDIHGQHDGQKLLNPEYHMEYLDRFCHLQEEKEAYLPVYQELLRLKKEIRQLQRSEQERSQRVDMLQYQIEEIRMADLKPGEEEALTERKAYFDHAASLAENLNESYYLLDGTEDLPGIVADMTQVEGNLEALSDLSEELQSAHQKAVELHYLAEDLAHMILTLKERIDFSPEEQDQVEERLSILARMKRKYGENIPEILDYYEKIQLELEELEDSDEKIQILQEQYEIALQKAKKAAIALSAKRQKGALELQKKIMEELSELDMQKVRLHVQVNQGTKLTASGLDQVEFLVSTNSGEEEKPLAKIASGGELSRMMLAIKNVLTKSEDIGTLIFDEIDTGVSGHAAQKIAGKLHAISTIRQTLCVTHLPQIAAMGDHQFLIQKTDDGVKTVTEVTPLSGEQRVDELARMISGEVITKTAKSNAQELLALAQKYKLN